jgi:hypothetical protein
VDNCGKTQSQKDGTAAHAQAGREIRGPRPAGATAGLRACSACAGDYEDPDGRAWGPDESGGDEREDEADRLAE